MANYKEMYYLLFNEITDVIESLKKIQLQAEELYITKEQKPNLFSVACNKNDDEL